MAEDIRYEPWRLESIQQQMLRMMYAGMDHQTVVGVTILLWTAMGDPQVYPTHRWLKDAERRLREHAISQGILVDVLTAGRDRPRPQHMDLGRRHPIP